MREKRKTIMKYELGGIGMAFCLWILECLAVGKTGRNWIKPIKY